MILIATRLGFDKRAIFMSRDYGRKRSGARGGSKQRADRLTLAGFAVVPPRRSVGSHIDRSQCEA